MAIGAEGTHTVQMRTRDYCLAARFVLTALGRVVGRFDGPFAPARTRSAEEVLRQLVARHGTLQIAEWAVPPVFHYRLLLSQEADGRQVVERCGTVDRVTGLVTQRNAGSIPLYEGE
jgi:hypothetical protein